MIHLVNAFIIIVLIIFTHDVSGN